MQRLDISCLVALLLLGSLSSSVPRAQGLAQAEETPCGPNCAVISGDGSDSASPPYFLQALQNDSITEIRLTGPRYQARSKLGLLGICLHCISSCQTAAAAQHVNERWTSRLASLTTLLLLCTCLSAGAQPCESHIIVDRASSASSITHIRPSVVCCGSVVRQHS